MEEIVVDSSIRCASVKGSTMDSSELPVIEVPLLSSTPTILNFLPSMYTVLPTTFVLPNRSCARSTPMTQTALRLSTSASMI